MIYPLLAAVLFGVALAANPQPPRSRSGSLDCSGPVGVSASGTGAIPQVGLISFRKTLFNKGSDWNQATGEMTIVCPGVYFVSFTAQGDKGNTRVSLKKKTSNQWTPVVSAGSLNSFGGTNSALLDLKAGDQLGLWLASGNIRTSFDTELPTTSFNAFRITTK